MAARLEWRMYFLKDEHVGAVSAAAETAIRRGGDLLNWWNTACPALSPVKHKYQGVTMDAFFEPMAVDGQMKLGMGCLQTSTFLRGPVAEGRPAVDLREWMMENGVRECYRPSRLGEGFLYRPLLVRRKGPEGELERLPAGLPIRLADIGTEFEWAVLRLDMPDYARAFPLPDRICRLMKLVLNESGSVVFHPVFYRSPRPPLEGAVAQMTFGYAVVPWKIEPTILGFGPGRFFAAFKQYRVGLMKDGSVQIEVVFVVCPRSEKILDLWGLDPVYGTVRVLNALSFGRTAIERKVHDAIDRYAMGHHGRVHVNMLDGLRDLWEGTNWTMSSNEHPESPAARETA